MNELPKWPDIGPCREGWYAYPEIPEEYKSCIHPYMVENSVSGTWYHKDAYEAAIARLRLAVEALKKRSFHLEVEDPHYSCARNGWNATGLEKCTCGADAALEALRQIGPLP